MNYEFNLLNHVGVVAKKCVRRRRRRRGTKGTTIPLRAQRAEGVKTGEANCPKIDDGNPNTDIHAYSETTFGGPTIGYLMTENWIYGCCGFCEDVSDSHLGHTENGHKKTAPRIRFVNHIKTLLE